MTNSPNNKDQDRLIKFMQDPENTKKAVEGSMDKRLAKMDKVPKDLDELKEQLADIEHQRWADWQAYCHKVLRENITSCPQMEVVLERWDRQIATDYKDLTEKEKDSDRDQVDRYWYLIAEYTDRKVREARIDDLESLSLISKKMDGVWIYDTIVSRLAQLQQPKGEDKDV